MKKFLRPSFHIVWEIAKASFTVLRSAPKLLGFSLLRFLMALVAAAPFLTLAISYFNRFPWAKLNESLGHSGQGSWKFFSSEFHAISWPYFLLALGLFTLWILGGAFVQIFSQIAIISAILSYFRGEKISFANAINEAWSLRKTIWKWAVLSTAVNWLFALISVGIRLLDIIPWLSRYVLAKIGDVTHTAWNMATFFVVPILIHERLPVAEAFKQSVALMKARWKEVAIIKIVGLGDIFILLIIPLLLLWFLGWFVYSNTHTGHGDDHVWGRYVADGVIFFIMFRFLSGLLNSVLTMILRTTLYIHATEGIVPAPFTAELMENAWVVKKSPMTQGDNFFMRQQENLAPGSGPIPGVVTTGTTMGEPSLFRQLGLHLFLRRGVALLVALVLIGFVFSWATEYASSWFKNYTEISQFQTAAYNGDLGKVTGMVKANLSLVFSRLYTGSNANERTALHMAAWGGPQRRGCLSVGPGCRR